MLIDHAVEHAMIVTDTHGTITDWSAGAEKLLGWSAGEAVGQPVDMIYSHEDRAAGAPQEEMNTALALGRSANVRWHMRKDGVAVFCDGVANQLVDRATGTLLGFGKVLRKAYSSATEAADDDGARSEQRSFLAAVLESVESGVVACDRHGRLTFFNEAAQEIHGLPAQPLAGERWAEHYHLYRADGETLLPLAEIPLQRALAGERVEQARIVVRTPDGRRRAIEVTGRPLRDGSGQVLGAVISMHDVSARQEADDARAAALREQDRRAHVENSNAQLRRTEEQLRLATDAARLGIWTWSARADRGTWENEEVYRIFGVAHDTPIEDGVRLMTDFLHPDDIAPFRQAMQETLRSATRFHFTGRIHHARGPELRWIEVTGALAPHMEGAGKTVIGTVADITARKDTERTLEEARVRLAATLNAGEVGTWIWDIRHDRIIGDRNLARLFGVSTDAVEGAPLAVFTEVIHPDDIDEVTRQIRHAVESGEPYTATYRVRHPAQGYRWLSARGGLQDDADGQPLLLAGVILDITRQKEIQDALTLAEERYRTLITSMDEAFAIIQVLTDDAGNPVDYRFEQVNRAIEEQSGLVDAAGKTIREMVPDIEQRWIDIYGRVALSREPIRFTEHSAAMGYWWDVYAAPIGAPAEQRIAILFTDITARRQAEEKLRQTAADLSETNRRKTEFLATLAHELRNPLAPMRTGVDLMRMTAQGGGKVLDMMDRQLRQMVHLIDDLMDISRINSGKIVLQQERLELKEVIANAVEAALPAIEAARHEMRVDVPAAALPVQADPTRLAQVLSNLLTNAVKYTPQGGRIALSARQADASVQVAVTDTGIGIPLGEQERVFDMFSQVSRNLGHAQGGLGIGLSLVRSLVEMHGGRIAVDSAGTGQGATFTVTLPLAGADAGMSASVPAAPQGAGAALAIVIADDNVDAADMLGTLLQALGHRVEIVHDGVQALQAIGALAPDVAILDIGMPGLNGYEVARQARLQPGGEQTMLIALTGWGGELDRSRSSDAGFDAHLTKPASLDALEELLAGATARGRTPK